MRARTKRRPKAPQKENEVRVRDLPITDIATGVIIAFVIVVYVLIRAALRDRRPCEDEKHIKGPKA